MNPANMKMIANILRNNSKFDEGHKSLLANKRGDTNCIIMSNQLSPKHGKNSNPTNINVGIVKPFHVIRPKWSQRPEFETSE